MLRLCVSPFSALDPAVAVPAVNGSMPAVAEYTKRHQQVHDEPERDPLPEIDHEENKHPGKKDPQRKPGKRDDREAPVLKPAEQQCDARNQSGK
jgi:hypothetical protein